MNEDDHRDIIKILKELLANQYLGVLGTQNDGQPHTSLVGFIASDSFDKIIFAFHQNGITFNNSAFVYSSAKIK